MRYTFILIPKNPDKDCVFLNTNNKFNSMYFDKDNYYIFRFDNQIKYIKRIGL